MAMLVYNSSIGGSGSGSVLATNTNSEFLVQRETLSQGDEADRSRRLLTSFSGFHIHTCKHIHMHTCVYAIHTLSY